MRNTIRCFRRGNLLGQETLGSDNEITLSGPTVNLGAVSATFTASVWCRRTGPTPNPYQSHSTLGNKDRLTLLPQPLSFFSFGIVMSLCVVCTKCTVLFCSQNL